jgi:hypothetical protein
MPAASINTWSTGEIKLTVSNPHQSDVSRDLLAGIFRQGGIGGSEWEKQVLLAFFIPVVYDMITRTSCRFIQEKR